MSAIADAIGGSKGTLWSYFASKKELFTAVVDDRVNSFAEGLDPLLTGTEFSIPTLRKFCALLCQQLLREQAVSLYRLIIAEGERFPEISQVFYERGPDRLHRHLTDFFGTRFNAQEAAQLARLTISAMVGYRTDAVMHRTLPTVAQQEAYVDSFIDHIQLSKPLKTV
jgi:AcrR family transcriptional regulator